MAKPSLLAHDVEFRKKHDTIPGTLRIKAPQAANRSRCAAHIRFRASAKTARKVYAQL